MSLRTHKLAAWDSTHRRWFTYGRLHNLRTRAGRPWVAFRVFLNRNAQTFSSLGLASPEPAEREVGTLACLEKFGKVWRRRNWSGDDEEVEADFCFVRAFLASELEQVLVKR